jgi:integral membrane protein
MHQHISNIRRALKKAYDGIDGIFSDKEAWMLFKVAAFVETFGWTCLIFAIVATKISWPYADTYIAVGGSIHGILYLFYVFIVIFTHRSLKWSVWRFLFAEAISVVPYGALVFEWWVSHRRKHGKV